MSNFGLTPQGFKPMALGDARADLQGAMRAAFGDNVNLDSRTLLGNLVDIFAERSALLWQLAQGIYGSTNPAEATGLGVDNILALNNLTRLPARASVTAPTPAVQANGITLYGLVLTGDAGTVVPKGALISNGLAAPTTFELDGPVTIGPATNAQQMLAFSNAPNAGNYALTFTDAAGNALTTPPLGYGMAPSDLQALIAGLALADGTLPLTDVVVSASGTGYLFDYGGQPPAANEPSTAATPIALIAIASSTLTQASAVTNLTVLEPRVGAPAQGIGSATCTATGPSSAPAHSLTTIVTPQAGWKGVDNQLDAIVGSDIESDADALSRLSQLRSAQGSASLSAIVERVKQAAGVTAAIGFENKTGAALQRILFSKAPTQGSFALGARGGQTALISAPASAADVTSALRALPNYESAQAIGDMQGGLTVDFGGAEGGQAQPLLAVINNTTDATAQVVYGRPAHSVEVVVDGGQDADVAAAILAALPAGVSSWGTPAVTTLGSINAGSASLSVASAVGAAPGQIATMASLPLGTQVASVSGQSITCTQVGQSTVSNASLVLQAGALISDAQSNAHLVTFTRPQKTLIYVQVVLTTDQRLQPGQANSGTNPSSKFSVASVATIQQAVADAINETAIGGVILARGTAGVANSFREIPGIVDAAVYIDTQSPPSNTGNLPLGPAQSAVCELGNVAVSYS